jgi:excisionase family DNA binding protein
MNLKTAASRLGVHYQSVYRWVRSGELPAVRHGAVYDVSEAALELFERRRAAQATAPGATANPASVVAFTPLDPHAQLQAELDVLRRAPASSRGVLHRVVHQGAELFGGLCVVRLVGDGPSDVLEPVAWAHPDLGRLAAWSELIESTPVYLRSARERMTVNQRELIVMDHIPQDAFRARIRPENAHLLDYVRAYSGLIAPIAVDGGPLYGFLDILRDEPGLVFTETDQTLAVELARSIAGLVDHADSFAAAKRLRNRLAEDIRAALDTEDDLAVITRSAQRIVETAEGSATLVGPDRRFLAASTAFLALIGDASLDIRGVRAPGLSGSPTTPTPDRHVFERLWSGELDSICLTRTRSVPAGDLELDLHWTVVRTRDSQPRFLVVTHSCRTVQPRRSGVLT